MADFASLFGSQPMIAGSVVLGVFLLVWVSIFYRPLQWAGRVFLIGLGLALIAAPIVVLLAPVDRTQTAANETAANDTAPAIDSAPAPSDGRAQSASPEPEPSDPSQTDDVGAVNDPIGEERQAPAEAPAQQAVEPGVTRAPATRSPATRSPATRSPAVSTERADLKTPFEQVPVFFGTDRAQGPEVGVTVTYNDGRPTGPVSRVSFGPDRGRQLVYGMANVTVPTKAREACSVTRPWELTVLNVTLYREQEDPAKHFTIRGARIMAADTFFASLNGHLAGAERFKGHAFIFVHGYNVSFDHALYRTAQIAYDLNFDGAPMLYSWPSQGAISSYEADQNASDQARPFLKRFIENVLARGNVTNLHFIAHSMGNKPLLDVLNQLDMPAEVPSDLRIKQVVLAAPDVDRDVFTDAVRELLPLVGGVTLYASGSDRAMLASRTYSGGVRAGDIVGPAPLVVSGIDTIDISAASTDVLALNHSTYAEKSELLVDIGRLFRTGTRPPEVRTPIFRPISSSGRLFWRYPRAVE